MRNRSDTDRETFSLTSTQDGDRKGHHRSLRVFLSAVLTVTIVGAVAVGIHWSTRSSSTPTSLSPRAVDDETTADASTVPIPYSPVVVTPAAGAPFPTFGQSNGISQILHHSGGPYIGDAGAQATVLGALGCSLGGPQAGVPAGANTSCQSADVAFFDHYSDAWAIRGANWQFVATWGPDREIYVVTVWGRLFRYASMASLLAGGFLTNAITYEVDATTGDILLIGGNPLPTADAVGAH